MKPILTHRQYINNHQLSIQETLQNTKEVSYCTVKFWIFYHSPLKRVDIPTSHFKKEYVFGVNKKNEDKYECDLYSSLRLEMYNSLKKVIPNLMDMRDSEKFVKIM